jgi:hypothetical protein
VVEPTVRGTGIGATLVDSSELLARDLGINELYLLTETAEAWFARRGYLTIGRDRRARAVRGSIEFTTGLLDDGRGDEARARDVTGARRPELSGERRDPGEGDDRDQPEAERGGDDDRERRGEA